MYILGIEKHLPDAAVPFKNPNSKALIAKKTTKKARKSSTILDEKRAGWYQDGLQSARDRYQRDVGS